MNEIWVDESPIYLTAGDEPTFSLAYGGATSVTATGATMTIYKNGTGSDLASTNLTGSMSASGNVLTLKKLQSLVGGNTYVVAVKATVDSVVTMRKFMVIVQRDSTAQ